MTMTAKYCSGCHDRLTYLGPKNQMETQFYLTSHYAGRQLILLNLREKAHLMMPLNNSRSRKTHLTRMSMI